MLAKKKQSSSQPSCAGMPEDLLCTRSLLVSTVCRTGSDSFQSGSCYSTFAAALRCGTWPLLQDTVVRPSVCLSTLLSLWSPKSKLHVFFLFPFLFPQITGFCTVWEPQLSRCTSLCLLMQSSALETFSLDSGGQVASVHSGCKSSAVQGWSRNWLQS